MKNLLIYGVGGLVLLVAIPLMLLVAIIPAEEEAAQQHDPCQSPGGGVPAGESPTVAPDSVPEEYVSAVESAADHAGIPPEVIAAQIEQESGWNPDATSPVGAHGIAQFMPDTAAQYDLDTSDPQASIEALGRYMADLQEQVSTYADDADELTELMLAAYNAGPGAVQDHDGIPPYQETEGYVETITSTSQGSFSADCTPAGGHQANIDDLGPGEWTHPLPGGIQTSGFGSRPCPIAYALNCEAGVSDHRGIDISTGPPGSTVVAPMDLEIRDVATRPGLGETVLGIMTEEPNLHVEFGHCQVNSFHVEAGDTVPAGTPLCQEGTTGNSEAIHLHLQFGTPDGAWDRDGWDTLIDPEPFLKEKGIL